MHEKLTVLKHRPLLDGIRGVFLLFVIGYHLGGPFRVSGGWVVMDLFFVLSGYLITTLLIKERERTGRIALTTFYRRRIRRLGPSILVVVGAITLTIWLLGWTEEFPTTRMDGVATLFYVANWHFIITKTSYFSSFDKSLFEHAWSLSIEEQFYLLWPLFILGMIRLFRHRHLVMAGAMTFLLIPASIWIHHLTVNGASLSRIYFGTDTRAPAFLVGGIIALVLWPNRWDTPRGQTVGAIIGTVGAVGFVLVCLFFTLTTKIYSRYLFVIGYLACAVLIFGAVRATRGPLVWIFGNRLTCHLGRISYVAYLWHWPVIILIAPPRFDLSPPVSWIIQLAVVFALSELTHHFIEEPIHRRRISFRFQGQALAGSALAVLLLVLVLPASAPPQAPDTGFLTKSAKPGAERVMVLGDSAAWVDAGAAPKDLPYQISSVFEARCDIIGDLVWTGSATNKAAPDCDKWPERWSAGIEKVHPDVVFVTLGLRQLFDLYDPAADGKRIRLGTPAWEARYRAAVDRAVRVIRSRTDAPILWLEVPCADWTGANTAGEEHDPRRIDTVNRVLSQELAKSSDIQVVPYRNWVCPDGKLDLSLRPDGAHLTKAGVAELWHRVLVPRIDTLDHSEAKK